MVNNWILLFSALFVLFATMFPTLSEAVTGNRLTVAGAVLQQVDGADRPHPAVPHRRRPAARVAQVVGAQPARLVPVPGGARASSPPAALAALGMRVWVVGAVLRAVRRWSSARSCRSSAAARTIRRRNTGTDLLTAIVGLVGRNKRRYGGYIVHLGIVLIFLGFAGNGFKRDEQVLLKPGEEAKIGRYTIRNDGIKVSDDGQKQVTTAYLSRFPGRQADRHAVSGEVGVPQPRERADDRGGDPAHVRRGSVHRAGVPAERPGDADGDAADHGQPAGQLDLARVRHHGARHRHRAAAGARLLVRAREAAGRDAGVDDGADAAARGAALRRHAAVGPEGDGRARPIRTSRRRTTRATSSRRRCSTRSSAPAARAGTRRSPSAARIRA